MSAVSISRRTVKPSDCALAFGIPTSEGGFLRAQQDPGADFAKRFLGGWPQYYSHFIIDLEKVEPWLRKSGATVVREATLGDFTGLFQQRFAVVILFSHWHANAVEFAGGLADSSSLVAAIPPDFAGIIDLCVCHPDALVRELQVQRPHCLVKYIPGEAAAHHWIYFYRTVFGQLESRELTYLAAVEEVVGAFLDLALPKNRGQLCRT